ncbi:MAG: UbiH/UbiF/VisC/COQ6 family ubiquinone biosynthesis hydroxylase [Pseudomonadota bacterium]
MDNPVLAPIWKGMDFDSDILIVGGGINGSVLALGLAQTGRSVTVIDAQPEAVRRNAGFDGRSYALALTSVRLLKAIGIWDRIADKAQPMLEIKVSQGRAGDGPDPFFLHFDHAELEEGPMGHMCEDRFLRRALLYAMAEDDRIAVVEDQVVSQSVMQAGVTLELASGKALTGRLLVGCDGRGSGTATRAGIKRTGWGYGQTALVAALEHERPHHGIAHQFFMPQGPLAILPLPGNVSSIVWSENESTANEFAALSDAEFLKILRPRFGDFLGDIAIRGKRYTYPLGLSIAQQLIAERLVLVGDSAHGVHPLAGQGLNAGLRDAAALVQVVKEAARRGEDYGTEPVLERYAGWRRFDITALAMVTDGTNRLFSNENALLRAARGIGMGVINALPGLRRGMMREAAGLSGDLPDLMKP